MLSKLQRKQAVLDLGARPMLKGLLNDDLRRLQEQTSPVWKQTTTTLANKKPETIIRPFPF